MTTLYDAEDLDLKPARRSVGIDVHKVRSRRDLC